MAGRGSSVTPSPLIDSIVCIEEFLFRFIMAPISCTQARKFAEKIVTIIYQSSFNLAESIKPEHFFHQVVEDFEELPHLFANHRWGLLRNNLTKLGQFLEDFKHFQHVIDVPTVGLYVELLKDHVAFCNRTLLYWVSLRCNHLCPHYEPPRLAIPQGISDPESDPDCTEPDNYYPHDESSEDEEPVFRDLKYLATTFARRWYEIIELLHQKMACHHNATPQSTKFDFADYEVIMELTTEVTALIDHKPNNTDTKYMQLIHEKCLKALGFLRYYGAPRDKGYFMSLRRDYVDVKFDHHRSTCIGCSMHLEHCWNYGVQWSWVRGCAAAVRSDCVVHTLIDSASETMSRKAYFWWNRMLEYGHSLPSLCFLLGLAAEKAPEIEGKMKVTRALMTSGYITYPLQPVIDDYAAFKPVPFNVRPVDESQVSENFRILSQISVMDFRFQFFLALALSGQLRMARYYSTLDDPEKHSWHRISFQHPELENDKLESPTVTLILNGIFNKFRTGQHYYIISELKKVRELMKPQILQDGVEDLTKFIEGLTLRESDTPRAYIN